MFLKGKVTEMEVDTHTHRVNVGDGNPSTYTNIRYRCISRKLDQKPRVAMTETRHSGKSQGLLEWHW